MPRLESRLRGSYLGDSDNAFSQGSVMGEALLRVALNPSNWITFRVADHPRVAHFLRLEKRCGRPISVVSAFCGGGFSFSRRRRLRLYASATLGLSR
jgi:hypothetical protein